MTRGCRAVNLDTRVPITRAAPLTNGAGVGPGPIQKAMCTMFSQTIEYALRAMIALTASDGSPTTTKRIAETMKVPASYLSKVLQSLVRARLVRSTRGLRGGFVLASAADQITMLDVVNAVSPIRRIRSCPLDLDNHSSQLCPLHRRLDLAMSQVEEAMRTTTLAELISEENPCPTLQQQLENLQKPG